MDFYIFKYSPDLENLPFVNNWMNFFFVFVSLLTCINFFFLTRCLYFHHFWWEREKNQFFKYFSKILPKCDKKILEIHEQSWLWITWILKKSDSIQTFVEDIPKIKLTHWSLQSKTFTFHNSNSHCLAQIWYFILIITLSLFRFCVMKSQL